MGVARPLGIRLSYASSSKNCTLIENVKRGALRMVAWGGVSASTSFATGVAAYGVHAYATTLRKIMIMRNESMLKR
jgi:hypothetical protein